MASWQVTLVTILILLLIFHFIGKRKSLELRTTRRVEVRRDSLAQGHVLAQNDQGHTQDDQGHVLGQEEHISPDNQSAGTYCEHKTKPVDEGERWKRQSKGQVTSCKYLERVLGRRLKLNYRPNWLKNPETGRNLEIDCYDETEKIGLEFHGEQHYEYNSHFHKGKVDNFIGNIRRDDFKKRRCEQLGIYLIEVPYILSHTNIEEHVQKHLDYCRYTRSLCQRGRR